jgi:hypothetical protein
MRFDEDIKIRIVPAAAVPAAEQQHEQPAQTER